MSSTARSCAQCRSSKVKCDLVRPVCGRCTKRGTPCTGYQAAGSFTFRDETQRAGRLSRRARGQPEEEPPKPGPAPQQTPSPVAAEFNAVDLKDHYPWLNERALANLPPQIKRSSETLAIEYFFSNWIAYPSSVSPGYMHHLPALYERTTPNSVLALSVRAVAFADLRRLSNGNHEYVLKGLQNYGAAITRLRAVVQEPKDFDDDQTLAALLLIDAFETLYMGRNEPLGLHDKALKYVLEVRGIDQLYSHRRFCLARVAIFRLQARQLWLGEGTGELQQTMLDNINQERPDLRVMYHVSQIVRLCARVKGLAKQSTDAFGNALSPDVSELLQEVEDLISSIETWTSSLDINLKPMPVVADLTSQLNRMSTSDEDNPMDTFHCPGMLKHQDITLAFLWSFYAAAQIILREHTMQVLDFAASISESASQNYRDRIEVEKLAIDGLSSSIVRSFPNFMGFNVVSATRWKPRNEPSQASSLGRFLGVFAMLVVKRSDAASTMHKQCAEKVLSWMHVHDTLGGT